MNHYIKNLRDKIKPLGADEVHGKRAIAGRLRRAEEAAKIKWEDHKLYGIQQLTTDDLFMAWNTPETELRACAVYELERSIVGGWIQKYRDSNKQAPKFLEAWIITYSHSWSLLDKESKNYYIKNYKGEQRLPCAPYVNGMCDIWPQVDGKLFLMKIDLKISNTELKEWFGRLLEKDPIFRDRKIYHESSVKEYLQEIAAHRIYSSCGSIEPWKFTLKLNSLFVGKKSAASLFTKKNLLEAAFKRYESHVTPMAFRLKQDAKFDFWPVSSVVKQLTSQ